MKLTARVPATVANLGPGFDCFGLALSLHNEITVDTEAEPGIHIEGEGADELPSDDRNLVLRTMSRFADDAGTSLPTYAVSCMNRIPLERGLGSSAAAVVGGLLLADRLLGTDLEADQLLNIATHLEGHADNAAAALLGGVAIAYPLELDGGWRAERLEPSSELRPVVLIPEERVNTEAARRALPAEVPREDATFNASRAALLALALTSRPDLLGVALQDRLHQDRRLELSEQSRGLFDVLRTGFGAVCVAGSGPTLLAFESDDLPVPDPGDGWRVLRPEIDREGANVLEAGPGGL